ncbi:hypothetical protein ABFS83_11G108000 [Erythranthe nasuta]
MDNFEDFDFVESSQVYISATEEYMRESREAMENLKLNFSMHVDVPAMMDQLPPPPPPAPTSVFSPPNKNDDDGRDYSDVIKKLEDVDSRKKQLYNELRQMFKLMRHVYETMERDRPAKLNVLIIEFHHGYVDGYGYGSSGYIYNGEEYNPNDGNPNKYNRKPDIKYPLWYYTILVAQDAFRQHLTRAKDTYAKKAAAIGAILKSTPIPNDEKDDFTMQPMVHQFQNVNLDAPDPALDGKGDEASAA